MTAPERNDRLVMDIGMSEGNDTSFYLQKGFSVVGVEADPVVAPTLLDRFATEIASGELVFFHRAAAGESGKTLRFWRSTWDQGHSKLAVPGQSPPTGWEESEVTTVDWPELQSVRGTPYYLKIDVEGGEAAFLSSIDPTKGLPTYISAECHSRHPIEIFRDLGYTKFRLISQTKLYEFPIPNPPLEGAYVTERPYHHWSGFFGRELPGTRWYDYAELIDLWDKIKEVRSHETVFAGWLDCHATGAGAT